MTAKRPPREFPCPRHGAPAMLARGSELDGYEVDCHEGRHTLTEDEARSMVAAWPDAPNPLAELRAEVERLRDETPALCSLIQPQERAEWVASARLDALSTVLALIDKREGQ